MRALLSRRRLRAAKIAGIAIESLSALVTRLRAARYAAIVWAPGQLRTRHADLIVHQLCELTRELNAVTRCAGLALGGDHGALTAAAVTSWQSGLPIRVDYATGHPRHDPYAYATARLLDSGRADVMLWIAAFPGAEGPPATAVPTAVLAHPRVALRNAPEIFIPVGVPGVDHAGHLFRCDSIVALPLPALRAPGLPAVADVLEAVRAELA
jgi:formylmethanofuran dehydrogenase subunit B